MSKASIGRAISAVISCLCLFGALCLTGTGGAQSQMPDSILIKASRLFDVTQGRYVEDAEICIQGDRIKEVGRAIVEADPKVTTRKPNESGAER